MFFKSSKGRERFRTTSIPLGAMETLEDRRALTAIGIASEFSDVESNSQLDGSEPRTGSFTSYDVGLDTVVAQSDRSSGLLPAVQKFKSTDTSTKQPQTESFTSYDVGLDTVVAKDRVFAAY